MYKHEKLKKHRDDAWSFLAIKTHNSNRSYENLCNAWEGDFDTVKAVWDKNCADEGNARNAYTQSSKIYKEALDTSIAQARKDKQAREVKVEFNYELFLANPTFYTTNISLKLQAWLKYKNLFRHSEENIKDAVGYAKDALTDTVEARANVSIVSDDYRELWDKIVIIWSEVYDLEHGDVNSYEHFRLVSKWNQAL